MNNLMQDKEIIENGTLINYYYASYHNYKAIKDFHLINGFNDSYLTAEHWMVLAFMVEKFYKDRKMPMIENNGERYVLMNTNFIKDNLIYLKVKERTIKNYISKFKKFGLIKVIVIDGSNRYVNINSELLDLYYEKHFSIRPINHLIKNKPHLWKSFVHEWEPHFPTKEDFKLFIDNFNNTRDIENFSYNSKYIYEHLLNAVRYKLYNLEATKFRRG